MKPPFTSFLFPVVCTLLSTGLVAADAPAWESKVQGYLEANCLKCHDGKSDKSDFRIDNLSHKVGMENTSQWREIVERISSGEMPPKKEKKRPSAEESNYVVDWLSGRLLEGESARLAARGPVNYNRLTRDEYVNTIRDLLGVQFDAADPGGLLEDAEWHGFERLGSVMTLSPSNIEKYLAAAELVLNEAYPVKKTPPMSGTKRTYVESQISEPHRTILKERGLFDKIRNEMWPGDLFRYSNLENNPAMVLEPGVYEISYTLSGLRAPGSRPPRLLVYENKLDRVLHEQDVIAAEDKPTTVTFRAHLPKGRPSIDVINDIPGPSNLPRSGRHGNKPFISTKEGRIPWQVKLTDEQGQPRYSFLILDTISWRGPIIEDDVAKRRAEYMPAPTTDLAQVREGFTRMARRAFRRPVSEQEIERYVGIVKAELASGEKFPDAVKVGMLSILCSKSVLFITEGDPETKRKTLNDWELATRLSYFLWSTMPDDELLAAAEQGKLRDKTELSRQTARLLADPRSQRFTDSFANQWLQLRKVGRFPPDKKLYPDYDANLEKSMVGETKAFFREVLQSGLTLREFINSDWTMMNARMATFYGLPEGDLPRDDFKRVTLPLDSHRGGLLTQAAILSLTSDGTRHRPVHRGVWISDSILGKVPPPPPANVEPIPTNAVAGTKVSLRTKLEAHIHDPHCAACHARMDPLGLAFENFDAIGRWRTEETIEGEGANPKVNPAGKFLDGRAYENPEQFKALLGDKIDSFNLAFIEKLATYGLRRAPTFADREALARLAQVSKEKNYRLRDIVDAFVLSDLFAQR